jgi:hypothetical protein
MANEMGFYDSDRSFSSLRLFRTNEGAVLQGDGRGASAVHVRCMEELTKDAVHEIEQIHSSWIEFEVAEQSQSLMALCATHAYIAGRKRCGTCSLKAECTSGQYKCHAIHIHEPARQRAPDLAKTPDFTSAQREQKKVEALFAGTQELDRPASAALAEIKVCSEAVLSGSDCAEHQTTGSIPQPNAKTAARRNRLRNSLGKRTPSASRFSPADSTRCFLNANARMHIAR